MEVKSKVFKSKIFWLCVSPYIIEIMLVFLGWSLVSFLNWKVFPLDLEISFEKIRFLFIGNLVMSIFLSAVFED